MMFHRKSYPAAAWLAGWMALCSAVPFALAEAGGNEPAAETRCAGQNSRGDVGSHIEFLKNRLSITPSEENAWQIYSLVLRETASKFEAAHANAPPRPPQNLSQEEHIRFATEMIRERDQNQAKLAQAAAQLLPALSEYQRGKASEILPGLIEPERAPGRGMGPPPPPL